MSDRHRAESGGVEPGARRWKQPRIVRNEATAYGRDRYERALQGIGQAGIKPRSERPSPRWRVQAFDLEGFCMSRVCDITGKRPAVGNRVSHANNKKRRRFLPNLHTQRFWLENEKRWVSLRVSTTGMRTIEKKGIDAVVAELRAQGVKI